MRAVHREAILKLNCSTQASLWWYNAGDGVYLKYFVAVKETGMNDKTKRSVVKFNEQQLKLLDNLKQSGKFGDSYEEVIRSVFREYVMQTIDRRER